MEFEDAKAKVWKEVYRNQSVRSRFQNLDNLQYVKTLASLGRYKGEGQQYDPINDEPLFFVMMAGDPQWWWCMNKNTHWRNINDEAEVEMRLRRLGYIQRRYYRQPGTMLYGVPPVGIRFDGPITAPASPVPEIDEGSDEEQGLEVGTDPEIIDVSDDDPDATNDGENQQEEESEDDAEEDEE
jgi:hypothetical protein